MGNKEGGSRRPFFFSPWQREISKRDSSSSHVEWRSVSKAVRGSTRGTFISQIQDVQPAESTGTASSHGGSVSKFCLRSLHAEIIEALTWASVLFHSPWFSKNWSKSERVRHRQWWAKEKFYRKGDMWKVDSEICLLVSCLGVIELVYLYCSEVLVAGRALPKAEPKKNRSWAGLRKKR
jgi:hypothetical protein